MSEFRYIGRAPEREVAAIALAASRLTTARPHTARIGCEIPQHVLADLGRNAAGRVGASIQPAIGSTIACQPGADKTRPVGRLRPAGAAPGGSAGGVRLGVAAGGGGRR